MNKPLATLCDQFLKERTYLKNVSPRTIIWYQVAFKDYRTSLAADAAALPTNNHLQQSQSTCGSSIRPVTTDTYVGAMNAFCLSIFAV